MKMDCDKIIEEIKLARLQGRGKKGYSTGDKMEIVKRQKMLKKYAICNISEGSPCSLKDLFIISSEELAKAMILGVFVSCKAVGAFKAFFVLRYEYKIFKRPIKK